MSEPYKIVERFRARQKPHLYRDEHGIAQSFGQYRIGMYDEDQRAASTIEALAEALKEIADERGICATCGTKATGNGAGVTACDCERPTWAPQDPIEIARTALALLGGNDGS